MFFTSKTTVARTAFAGAILSVGLPLLALSSSPARPPESMKLLQLPFFIVGGTMDEKPMRLYYQLAKDTVAGNVARDYSHISLLAAPYESIDLQTLTDVSRSGGGRAVRLLSPLCEEYQTDGVLAFWMEATGKKAYRLGSLLYLPSRIQLEALEVSVNFERETIELEPSGNFEQDRIRYLISTLLQRNLNRIITKSEEPAGSDRENDPADKQSDPASTRFPIRVGVLPFSRDLVQSDEELKKTFSNDAREFDFPKEIFKVTKQLDRYASKARRIDGPPITYNQIAAPQLRLDPNADPKAKEKRLADRCKAAGVDGLLFGHLYQKKSAGQTVETSIYVRLFLKNDLSLHAESAAWPVKEKDRLLRRSLEAAIKGVFRNAAQAPSSDYFEITVKWGDNLYKIAERCYVSDWSDVMDELARKNGITDKPPGQKLSSKDVVIQPGDKIKIFEELAGVKRRVPPCKSR